MPRTTRFPSGQGPSLSAWLPLRRCPILASAPISSRLPQSATGDRADRDRHGARLCAAWAKAETFVCFRPAGMVWLPDPKFRFRELFGKPLPGGNQMTAYRMTARVRVAVLATLLAIVSIGVASAKASAAPNSMDALGDSITRAFNTCSFPFVDCPENSWATGTNSKVDSYYLRLLAVNPGISGHNYNDAVSGAKMVELNGQAEKAVSRHVELVGVLMGANDACTSSLSTMTSVATYQSEFEQAM